MLEITADRKKNHLPDSKANNINNCLKFIQHFLAWSWHEIHQIVRPERWSPLPRKDQAWQGTQKLPGKHVILMLKRSAFEDSFIFGVHKYSGEEPTPSLTLWRAATWPAPARAAPSKPNMSPGKEKKVHKEYFMHCLFRRRGVTRYRYLT